MLKLTIIVRQEVARQSIVCAFRDITTAESATRNRVIIYQRKGIPIVREGKVEIDSVLFREFD